jgi:CheY-like chemotaxis protein
MIASFSTANIFGSPLKYRPRPHLLRISQPRTASRMNQLQREPCRILIVDDHVATARAYEILCRSWGHETRAVHSAAEATRLFDAFSPDLALVDIGLPGMSGYELARSVRLNPSHARIILVAVTGFTSDANRIEAFRVGFNEFMVKPVDIDRLHGIVNELCSLAA